MKLLQALIIASVAISLSGCGRDRFEETGLVRVADDVYAYIAAGAASDDGLGANSGFVVGRDAVLVIDSRFTSRHARELLDAIRSVTDLPIAWLVNTHYHPDHAWGNSLFREQGATIIARPETRDGMETYTPVYLEHYRRNRPDVHKMIGDLVPALPDSAAGKQTRIDLGGIEVLLEWFGPAHTAGDLVAAIPARRVIFAGGLVSNGYHANLSDQGADPDNWMVVLERLARMRPRVIVPGQGAPGGIDLLDRQAKYILDLVDLCVESIRAGSLLAEALKTIAVPGTEDYLHANILSFNVQTIYRRRVLDVVAPDFSIEVPAGFIVSDGGGATRAGMIQWAFQSNDGHLELEVRWHPTARGEVILADIYDAVARHLSGDGLYDLRIEGAKRIEIDGVNVDALHGRWSYRGGVATVGGGAWTWALHLHDGTLYSIRMLTNAGNDPDLERRHGEVLEQVVSTFRAGAAMP